MADPAADVQPPIAGQAEFTRRVTAVADGKQRRRQEGRFALAAMRVSGQNPSAKVAPDRKVGCVWIVAKHQTWPSRVEVTQHFLRIKVRPSVIVQTNHVQAIDRAAFIPKHHNTQPKQPCRDPVGHVGLRPAAAMS